MRDPTDCCFSGDPDFDPVPVSAPSAILLASFSSCASLIGISDRGDAEKEEEAAAPMRDMGNDRPEDDLE